jgi:hypothetical protein
VLDSLHESASRHSRRGLQLWLQAVAILRVIDRDTAIKVKSAKELNRAAIAELQTALNTLEFLHRYDSKPNK